MAKRTKKAQPRNRAAQDATLINIRALKKQVRALQEAVKALERAGRQIDKDLDGLLASRDTHEANLRKVAEHVGIELGMSS